MDVTVFTRGCLSALSHMLLPGDLVFICSSSAYNTLLLFEDVVRVGCHIIFLPAICTLWHGDCLVLLKSAEEHSHIILLPCPQQPMPSSGAATLASLV